MHYQRGFGAISAQFTTVCARVFWALRNRDFMCCEALRPRKGLAALT